MRWIQNVLERLTSALLHTSVRVVCAYVYGICRYVHIPSCLYTDRIIKSTQKQGTWPSFLFIFYSASKVNNL